VTAKEMTPKNNQITFIKKNVQLSVALYSKENAFHLIPPKMPV